MEPSPIGQFYLSMPECRVLLAHLRKGKHCPEGMEPTTYFETQAELIGRLEMTLKSAK